MDKAQIQKILIPALALAAVIVLVGLIVSGNSTPATPDKGSGPARNVVASSGDASSEGMSGSVPVATGPEWKAGGVDGLRIWDVKEGSGPEVARGQTVTIHYIGWLLDGTVFDSSIPRNEPNTFPLGNLIKGWQDGIPGMKPGGIRRLYIPWPIAYGEGGSQKIPPKSDLIFEIKLIAMS